MSQPLLQAGHMALSTATELFLGFLERRSQVLGGWAACISVWQDTSRLWVLCPQGHSAVADEVTRVVRAG